MESNHCKKIIGKQRTPREVTRSMVVPQFWADDTTMRYTKIPKWQEDGMNLMAKFSTISTYTIDILYSAPCHHWSRYENTITMKSGDPDLQASPMTKREDFKKTTKMLYSLRKEQGKVNSFIPKDKRTDERDELYTPRVIGVVKSTSEKSFVYYFDIFDAGVDTKLVE